MYTQIEIRLSLEKLEKHERYAANWHIAQYKSKDIKLMIHRRSMEFQ